MSEQVGKLIRKARDAAGITQAQLAGKVKGLSASSISKIERGIREPSDEELAAIAKATGVSLESLLGVSADEAPAESAKAKKDISAEGKSILELFDAADPAIKEAALHVLKGETQEKKDILESVLPAINEIMGGKAVGDNPFALITGLLGSAEGKALVDSLMGAASSMFQSNGAAGDEGQGGQVLPGSLLAFTFFYSVSIYILLLSFYFWQIRTDIKPEE